MLLVFVAIIGAVGLFATSQRQPVKDEAQKAALTHLIQADAIDDAGDAVDDAVDDAGDAVDDAEDTAEEVIDRLNDRANAVANGVGLDTTANGKGGLDSTTSGKNGKGSLDSTTSGKNK